MEVSEQTQLRNIIKKNGNKPRRKMTTTKEALAYFEKFDCSRSWLNSLGTTKKRYARLMLIYCAMLQTTSYTY